MKNVINLVFKYNTGNEMNISVKILVTVAIF